MVGLLIGVRAGGRNRTAVQLSEKKRGMPPGRLLNKSAHKKPLWDVMKCSEGFKLTSSAFGKRAHQPSAGGGASIVSSQPEWLPTGRRHISYINPWNRRRETNKMREEESGLEEGRIEGGAPKEASCTILLYAPKGEKTPRDYGAGTNIRQKNRGS